MALRTDSGASFREAWLLQGVKVPVHGIVSPPMRLSCASYMFGAILCCLDCFVQMNHDNQKICDNGCTNTYTEGGTLHETCGPGSGDNSGKVTICGMKVYAS